MTRRRLLAAGAVLGAGATGGCVQGIRGALTGPDSERLSFSIKVPPADADEPATRIARHLATNLQAVGIDARVVLKGVPELRRDVLQRDAFDLYVDRLPLARDPDSLRPLLHSESAGGVGWHNPFGYANPTVDALLDRQRRLGGAERRNAVADLLREIAAEQPFVSVAVPNDIGAVRTDRYENWQAAPVHSPLRYLGLRHRGEGMADRLAVAVTDDRITRNLNPLSARFRERGTVTGLLYETLGRQVFGEFRPWLAREWEWTEAGRFDVTLRPDLRWHDGEPITAGDVAFTYRFLEDTGLGATADGVPAPRLHGRASLVERAEALDRTTVRLEFGDTPAPVARRALTAPILPRHVWEPTAVETDSIGVEVADTLTEAIVRPNPEPVGSGPLEVRNRVVEEVLVLERFDDHFLHRPGEAERPLSGLDYRELHLRVTPAPTAAVELAENGDVDGTMALADPGVVPRIGREPSLTLTVDPAPVLYHVGFNVRRGPLGDARFRRTVARFLDKANIAEAVFDSYGMPVTTPYARTPWMPPTLEWEGDDPEVPFLGVDGELNVDRARERLRAIGFEYEDERVIGR